MPPAPICSSMRYRPIVCPTASGTSHPVCGRIHRTHGIDRLRRGQLSLHSYVRKPPLCRRHSCAPDCATALLGDPRWLVSETSRLHSPTFKKAKEKRTLVLMPVLIN